MHRVVLLKVGGTHIHLLKLFAALVVLGSAVMLLSSVYQLLAVGSLIQGVNAGAPQSVSFNLNAVQVPQVLLPGDDNTQLGLLLVPVANILFWCAGLVVGAVIYRAGKLIVPIEEDIETFKRK